jgi:diguanylate cyclase
MDFFRKHKEATFDKEELMTKFNNCEERQRFFLHTVRALLVFLKDFTLDFKEINAEGFKKQLNELAECFNSEKKTEKIESFFEKQKKDILAFIHRQKEYLAEKEKELKSIIELLTKTLATLDYENEEYNQRIYEQSEKIEQITFLNDIKQIKAALQEEAEQIRKVVQEKQANDKEKIERLAKQVSSLKTELNKVKKDTLRDGLTGLYTREAFEKYVSTLIERNTVEAAPFSMFVLGVDNYSKIKTTYGSKIGDRAVLAIAQQCQKFIKEDDFLARYNEETFAVVLPGVPLKKALHQARQLCQSIAKARYAVNDVQEGHVLSFTVSIGVSAHRSDDTLTTLLARVTSALDEAQRSGESQVVSEKGGTFFLIRAIFRRRWFVLGQ